MKMIRNPAGSFGLSADFQDTEPFGYQNNPAGTTRAVGDLVRLFPVPVAATYWPPQVDTTTTANDKTVIGVIGEKPATTGPDQPGGFNVGGTASTSGSTYLAGAEVFVVTRGPARINIAANVVAAGDILCASAAAGVAITNNAATVGQAIAIALEPSTAKDANNTIRAYICKM